MPELNTRTLGRTGRQVTTLGLGGQASIQWPGEGIDSVAIIEKAVNLGITYFDTSNIYGPSQKHFGQAFKRLSMTPGTSNYDAKKRGQIYLASKTHIRSARCPKDKRFRSDYSEGMADDFKVKTAVDDVKRSLSLMFGDGKGAYPEDAYLDCIQFHNLNTFDEVDMLYEGFSSPSPERLWMGALAAMLDLRDGTNLSGCNPGNEKLVRHIGISGHWSAATLIYAIQLDVKQVIDTLLVPVNPSDKHYMGHRHNSIAVAKAAGMGIIGMKVFADASYYHKEPKFSSSPADVYYDIGSEDLPSSELVQYSLSIPGVSTIITGIGHIDPEPARCQLEQNLAASQIEKPLSETKMTSVDEKVTSAEKDIANSSFQRPGIGLTAPRNAGVEHDFSMPALSRNVARITWDTSYSGPWPIDHYEVIRNGEVIGTVPHLPRYTQKRFSYDDNLKEGTKLSDLRYSVAAVDSKGNRAKTIELFP